MATVNTLSGPLDVDDLGRTYMHEHIFVVNQELQKYWPGYAGWDEDKVVEFARQSLIRLRQDFGCESILDPTVAGLGRDIRAMARAAEGTGVNVVPATGWYVYSDLPFAFYMKTLDEKIDVLTELFVADAEEGLEGTSIKAGVIKCSTDKRGVTSDVEALLRASARAAIQTGLPITTHSDSASHNGLDQQRIFAEEGVDPATIVIGHCNEASDLDYLEKLIENGTYIGFDRCGTPPGPGRENIPTLEGQIDNLATLIERGLGDRVVLSHDHMCFMDLKSPEYIKGRSGPDFPYGYIGNEVLPGLEKRSVDEAAIEQLLVGNPRAYFTAAAKGAGSAAADSVASNTGAGS